MSIIKKLISLSAIILMINSCAHAPEPRDVLPRNSFLYLNKVLTVYSCVGGFFCSVDNYKYSASAFVVKRIEEGAFFITAAHVCEDDLDMLEKGSRLESKYTVYNIKGKKFQAVELIYDRKIDVCLMYAPNISKDVEEVKIAPNGPQAGDRVYNIAAPRGIFQPNMVPILEGRYNGDAEGVAYYTLPAAPGSSGSMIVNENGQLVGMVHSVYIHFPVMTLSTKYDNLVSFIQTNVERFMLFKKMINYIKMNFKAFGLN